MLFVHQVFKEFCFQLNLHSTIVQYPHCQLFVFFLWMMFSSVSMDGVVSSNSSSRNHHDVLETCVKTKGSESLRRAEDLLFSYHVPRHVSWQYALGVYYVSCDFFRQGMQTWMKPSPQFLQRLHYGVNSCFYWGCWDHSSPLLSFVISVGN